MTGSDTLILIPTYNERDNVARLVPRLFECAPLADVMLVDDASPDGTADLAEELFGHDPRFQVLRRTGPRGFGRSYVDGYQLAMDTGYARVVQMDADLSHDPASIPSLIAGAETADVVIGSRYCQGGGVRDWPLRRRLLSRFANAYVAAVTGIPIHDATAGFRCHTRLAIERMSIATIQSNGYSFEVELSYRAVKAGLKVLEVPIVFTDRTRGHSKMSRQVLVESMLLPWRLRLRTGRVSGLAAAPSPRTK